MLLKDSGFNKESMIGPRRGLTLTGGLSRRSVLVNASGSKLLEVYNGGLGEEAWRLLPVGAGMSGGAEPASLCVLQHSLPPGLPVQAAEGAVPDEAVPPQREQPGEHLPGHPKGAMEPRPHHIQGAPPPPPPRRPAQCPHSSGACITHCTSDVFRRKANMCAYSCPSPWGGGGGGGGTFGALRGALWNGGLRTEIKPCWSQRCMDTCHSTSTARPHPFRIHYRTRSTGRAMQGQATLDAKTVFQHLQHASGFRLLEFHEIEHAIEHNWESDSQ